MTRATIVLNPAAGGGQALARWSRVAARVTEGLDPEVIQTDAAGHWERGVERAVADGVRFFVAAGGDGTVNGVVNALLRHRRDVLLDRFTLGAVGLGSSNDFHKPTQRVVAGVPLRVNPGSVALRVVCAARFRGVDGGVHVRHFVISASLGLTAEANAFFNRGDRLLARLKRHWTGGGRLLAVTVDTVLEELRVGLYRELYTAGRTAVISSLSDLAAVGAEGLGILLSVTLPERDPETAQVEIARGVRDACEEAGMHVLGGDTNEGRAIEIACVAVGFVDATRPMTRAGASAGHLVFSSGPMGAGAALAATALFGLGTTLYSEQEYRPPVRLAEGRALCGVASACMDTSDGLLATLDQLARINNVAIRVTQPLDALLHPKVEGLRQAVGLPPFPFVASHHGEFELVFTVPPERVEDLRQRAAALDWEPLFVGRVERGQGVLIGERALDGVWLRNLLHETRGDLAAYLQQLLAMEGLS